MVKESKTIARSFGVLVERELSMFKYAPNVKTDGARVYVYPLRSDLQLAIWTVTFSYRRRFKVEVSFSRGPVGPGFSAPPIPPSPIPPDLGVHLLSIVNPRLAAMSWYFGDPSEADSCDFVYGDPDSAARDAMSKVKQIGLPFLRGVVAREKPEAIADWDGAMATSAPQ